MSQSILPTITFKLADSSAWALHFRRFEGSAVRVSSVRAENYSGPDAILPLLGDKFKFCGFNSGQKYDKKYEKYNKLEIWKFEKKITELN